MPGTTWVTLAFAAAMACTAACGGGGGGGGNGASNQVCEAVNEAATRCGFSQGGGDVGGLCGQYATDTEYTQCLAACYENSFCSVIHPNVCSSSKDPQNMNGCTQNCYNKVWECVDGTKVKLGFLCDDFDDCPDHSDEKNCTYDKRFDCKNGIQNFPWSYWCDGDLDCTDGSDEQGCADVFCP
jgi:hypothetical protein